MGPDLARELLCKQFSEHWPEDSEYYYEFWPQPFDVTNKALPLLLSEASGAPVFLWGSTLGHICWGPKHFAHWSLHG